MMSFKNLIQMSNLQAIVIFLISCLLANVNGTVKSALTYKQLSTQLGQLVTSSTLVWETYTNDPKQLEYAVHGGKYVTEDEHYPIYVCRAIIDGIFTSGHTEKRRQTNVCVVSMHTEVKSHVSFDILINKGHGGKLTWRPWSKFSAAIPSGAVSASGSHIEDSYVARHKVEFDHNHNHPHNHHHSHHHQHQPHHNVGDNMENEHLGADYNLGRFDSRDRLGKIIVSEGNIEREFEDGEVLVETEPVRYELREIKIDKWRTDTKYNQTYLGSAILSNNGDEPTLVETVITYDYDKYQYWGSHDGIARGLPTTIYEIRVITEINWGLKYGEKRIETKAVSTSLQPGTALNVTLKGNYSSMEAPYSATLVAYYADNEESVSKRISTTVQKADMIDIKLEFSPVYWIQNGTLIPTTTTTTTTSTTTEPTSTSTREPNPVYSPPVVILNDLSSSSSSSSSSGSNDNNNGGHHNGAAVAASKKNLGDRIDDVNNDIVADESREIPPSVGDTIKQANVGPKDKKSNAVGQHTSLSVIFGCFLTGTIINLVSNFY